jgi:dTMP kinase
MFITFEGIDGCGKTTQWRLLSEFLGARGIGCVSTREPGGTPLAEEVREIVLHSRQELSARAELLLFAAARAQHVEQLIAPALDHGDWVLCDRFTHSTRAYQGGGLGLGSSFIDALAAFATQDTTPDLCLLFDLPVAQAQERRAREKPDRIEKRGLEFQERVRQAFQQMALEEPSRVVLIDASGSTQSIHETVVDILIQRGLLEQAASTCTHDNG